MLSSHPAMESERVKDTALAVPAPGWAAGDLRAPVQSNTCGFPEQRLAIVPLEEKA